MVDALIAEAAFQHKLWAPQLSLLLDICQIRIVLCEIDPELARARHIQRSQDDPQRQLYHDNEIVRAAKRGRALPIDAYDPPHLDVPLLKVDTSKGYQPDLDLIARFISH